MRWFIPSISCIYKSSFYCLLLKQILRAVIQCVSLFINRRIISPYENSLENNFTFDRNLRKLSDIGQMPNTTGTFRKQFYISFLLGIFKYCFAIFDIY